MIVIRARNVHQALPEALYQIRFRGLERKSRNGPVIVFPEPVTTVYEKPAERVIFWPQRDANPFFHLIESLWMLAGFNDVETVARYVENMRNFSDDGVSFHGAYGHRWINHFGFNQLDPIVEALKADKDCRRQVLSMWDTNVDLGRKGKDLPCNLQAVFQITPCGQLDMMVTNRSNDAVWGCYGANAVHFSYLHEFLARSVGVPQGVYRQVSANLHVYKENLKPELWALSDEAKDLHAPRDVRFWNDPYAAKLVAPYPLINGSVEDWKEDLVMFFSNPDAMGFRDAFFRKVAIPMEKAHRAFRKRSDPARFTKALAELENVKALDWRVAAIQWIERRQSAFEANKAKKAQDDGVSYD